MTHQKLLSEEDLSSADPQYRETSRYAVQNARQVTDKMSNTHALEVCDLSSGPVKEPLRGDNFSEQFGPARVSSHPRSLTIQTTNSALERSLYSKGA